MVDREGVSYYVERGYVGEIKRVYCWSSLSVWVGVIEHTLRHYHV